MGDSQSEPPPGGFGISLIHPFSHRRRPVIDSPRTRKVKRITVVEKGPDGAEHIIACTRPLIMGLGEVRIQGIEYTLQLEELEVPDA